MDLRIPIIEENKKEEKEMDKNGNLSIVERAKNLTAGSLFFDVLTIGGGAVAADFMSERFQDICDGVADTVDYYNRPITYDVGGIGPLRKTETMTAAEYSRKYGSRK